MSANPLRIVHVITGLEVGGAERVLLRLTGRMAKEHFINHVISLSALGPIGAQMQAQGTPVRALGLKPRYPNPWLLFRLARWLREIGPHVVQTWLPHANLIGGLATLLAGRPTLAWNIRHTNLPPGVVKRTTVLADSISARLSSRLPHTIVCCSHASRRMFGELGFDQSRMRVIPNGFDLEEFRPQPDLRPGVRVELGLSERDIVIGHIGRFHPQKDHRSFIAAAGRVAEAAPTARFVMCGLQVTWENQAIAGAIRATGRAEQFLLLGVRTDVSRILSAVDIMVSSSAFGEGFPNVVGEAMSSGVPCVVTDVGDSALIVGETGRVVPPNDAGALATACQELVEMEYGERATLGHAARARIEADYELGSIVRLYEALYGELARVARRSSAAAFPVR